MRVLEGDEPQAHAGRLSADHRQGIRGVRGPISRCRPISSSAFPARRMQDFADTMRLIDDVRFASAYSFKYSIRPGTPAAESSRDQVPEAVKSERLAVHLQARRRRAPSGFQCRHGRTERTEILLEKQGPRGGPAHRQDALSANRPDRWQPDLSPGDIVGVKILSQSTNSLFGRADSVKAGGSEC
jgi:tRNA-2-methylthio-N6-dimethylallyladenosine synthase